MLEMIKLDERIIQRRPWRCLVACGSRHTCRDALVGVKTGDGREGDRREDQVQGQAHVARRGTTATRLGCLLHRLPLSC